MTSNNNNKTFKKKTERPEIMRGDEKTKQKKGEISVKRSTFLWAPLIMSVLHSALKPSALPHFHQMTHSSTSRPAVP